MLALGVANAAEIPIHGVYGTARLDELVIGDEARVHAVSLRKDSPISREVP